MSTARTLGVVALLLALAACGRTEPRAQDPGRGVLENAAPAAPGNGKLKVRKVYDYVGDREGTPWEPFELNGEYNYPEPILGGWPVRVTPVDGSGNPTGPTLDTTTLQEMSPTDGRYLELPAGRYEVEELYPTSTLGGGVWEQTGTNVTQGGVTTSLGITATATVEVVAGTDEATASVVRFFNVCRLGGVVQVFPAGAVVDVTSGSYPCRPDFEPPSVGGFVEIGDLGSTNALAVLGSGPIHAASFPTVYQLAADGTTWTDLALPPATARSLIFDGDGSIYAGTAPNVYKLPSGGGVWQDLGSPSPISIAQALAFDASGNLFQALTDGGVYVLSGGVWVNRNAGLVFPMGMSLNGTEIKANAAGDLYLSTNNGAFRLANGAPSWVQLIAGLTNLNLFSLTIDAGGNVSVGTNAGEVFVLPSGGAVWSPLPTTGLPSTFVRSLIEDPAGNLYAGTDAGVYRLDSGGASWTSVNTGLPSPVSVYDFVFDGAGRLFAATSQGVFGSVP